MLETDVLMPDPIIFPLVAAAAVGALIPTTVHWSEVLALAEGKRPALGAETGKAIVTRENVAGKIIVKVTVTYLVPAFLPLGEPKLKKLGPHALKGDRLDRALEGKFNGKQSFDIPLTRPGGKR